MVASSSAPVRMPASSAGEPQAVLQNHDTRDAEQRAADRSASAVDGGAAEHDGRNGHQLVPGARVRLGLPDSGNVEKRGASRDEPAQHVREREPAADWDARVPGALG